MVLMLYYTKTASKTLEELGSSEHGLATSEAEERLRAHGRNEISVKGDPLWRKLIEPFANVFMLVLFIAVVISTIKGEILDASIIGVIMAATAIIYYIQRFSTERILRSLQQHDAQKVSVLRDGVTLEVDTVEIVPGDVFLLSEGEKIPADARIIDASSLQVDESQLTGESLPIGKHSELLSKDKAVYEQTNMLFQGSFVVSGEATAVVVTTGNNTEFGQLAALSSSTEVESPVQKKIDRLLSQIIAVVGGIAVVAFSLALVRGMEFTEALRFVLALSVSAVPESLPVAISVVLVLGMRRMAARNALVRTMRSIESVGVLTTIATDKTGTLTRNKLTVREIWHQPSNQDTLLITMAHALNQSSKKNHDPLDIAFADYLQESAVGLSKTAPLHSLPFNQAVAMSGNVWHHGNAYRLDVKGAPEHVLARSSLTDNEHEAAMTQLHRLTSQGYRVIAVATAELKDELTSFDQLPKTQRFEFTGFVAVADVLRPEAKHAIAAAQNAGVTVRMITGDHFETAYHIGRQLGMVTNRDQVFDSKQMGVMSDAELEKIVDNIRVFSRVVPEHKYRILAILKKRNITAMTGDGVNDVPALSNAHVGVAMGSGAQIAKDAGDIILLDDNFKSIIDAMREGRTIFANIRRMLLYLLSTNAGEVMTALGALLIGLPVPLVPVQILWVNLVTDTALVIPIGLEPGEKTNMKQKPKPPNAPILNRYMLTRLILVAVTMAVLTLTIYILYTNSHGTGYARTVAFTALVAMQWANAFNVRSDYESVFKHLRVFNGKFYIGLTIAIFLQMLALFGPLQGMLHIHPIAWQDIMFATTIAIVIPIVVVEIHKFIGRRTHEKHLLNEPRSTV